MAKISVNLDEDDQAETAEVTQKVAKHTKGRASVSKAKSADLKHAKRVQFSISLVPEPIKQAFEDERAKRGMTQKEFLYHCLRAGGLDIPAYEDIDGRRR